MKKIKDLLFDEEDLETGMLVEEMDTWKCLEEVDLSFNEIKCFDESMVSSAESDKKCFLRKRKTKQFVFPKTRKKQQKNEVRRCKILF